MHELRPTLPACVRQCQTAFTTATGIARARSWTVCARRRSGERYAYRPLKHDGDPLPGSPSVIPQRAHGRVGRVLWEIGTRTLKLASAPKVATRDLQSQLPYLESPLGGVAQLVRALPCHGRGRGFESRRSRSRTRRER